MNGRKRLCVYSHSANGQVFYVGSGRPQRLLMDWLDGRKKKPSK